VTVVLLMLINVVIMTMLLVVGMPLLAAWFATRRPGILTALRTVIAVSLGLLGVVNANVLLVLGALALGFWPRTPASRRVRVQGPPGRARRPGGLGIHGRRGTRIDPSAVGGVWSRLLRSALAAREEFAAAARRAPAGAIREQLDDLTGEVDRLLLQAWDLAQRGAELERSGREIHAASLAAKRSAQRWGQRPGPEDHRVVEAQRAHDEATGRLIRAIDEERTQLRILVARLGEAACSAAELAAAGRVRALPAAAGGDLGGELVDRLTALRGALAEASAIRPAV
jgi:hypothetical protein